LLPCCTNTRIRRSGCCRSYTCLREVGPLALAKVSTAIQDRVSETVQELVPLAVQELAPLPVQELVPVAVQEPVRQPVRLPVQELVAVPVPELVSLPLPPLPPPLMVAASPRKTWLVIAGSTTRVFYGSSAWQAERQ